MSRIRILFALTAVSVFVASCSKKSGVPGVSLVTQTMIREVGGLPAGNLPKGGIVQYLGAMSPDSSTMKILYNDIEGWVPRSSIALQAKPAIVVGDGTIYPTPDSEFHVSLRSGTFVAVDTTINGKSRIAYVDDQGSYQVYWIAPASLSLDSKDVLLITELENARGMTLEQRAAFFSKVAAENPGSPLLGFINVDLSEAPADSLTVIQNTFGVFADKQNGQLVLSNSDVETAVEIYCNDIFGPEPDPDKDGYGYRQSGVGRYFQRYISQLPSYVRFGPISDYIQYSDRLGMTQSMRAYLLLRVNRSPENILKLWNAYGHVVKSTLSLHKSNYEEISNLISVYDYIVAIPNYKKVCADVSKYLRLYDEQHKDERGFVTGGFVLEDQQALFEPILDKDITNANSTWYHSFWLRRFSEGNAEVVFSILKELAESGGVKAPGTVETIVCVFQDYSVGDCGHIEFDCGDYGEADTQQLSKEDKMLWDSLFASDSTGEHGNPALIGQRFVMKVGTTRGYICNEGQGGEGKVPLILSFQKATAN